MEDERPVPTGYASLAPLSSSVTTEEDTNRVWELACCVQQSKTSRTGATDLLMHAAVTENAGNLDPIPEQ